MRLACMVTQRLSMGSHQRGALGQRCQSATCVPASRAATVHSICAVHIVILSYINGATPKKGPGDREETARQPLRRQGGANAARCTRDERYFCFKFHCSFQSGWGCGAGEKGFVAPQSALCLCRTTSSTRNHSSKADRAASLPPDTRGPEQLVHGSLHQGQAQVQVHDLKRLRPEGLPAKLTGPRRMG